MKSTAPAGLAPFEVLFDHSEFNPALTPELRDFAGNVGFPPAPAARPWVFANFVQSIDGMVSLGGAQPGGEWIAHSRHDRWMMDLLRAHADAIISGARSLELEARFGRIPGGPVYRIVDPALLDYRHQTLGRRKLINIIVTGSGQLRVSDYRLFRSEHVESWIATTPEGQRQLSGAGDTRVLVSGSGREIDWADLAGQLRSLGVAHLLCEGGPALYGSMLRARLIDEKFLTISPQEIGSEHPANAPLSAGVESYPPRLTSFTGPGFSAETAQWFRLLSCRRAGEHVFLRYRAVPTPASVASE